MPLATNPIPKNGMFATPDSLDDVMAMLDTIPAKDGARVTAITAVMMTINYLSTHMDKFVHPIEPPAGFDEVPHG